jgi:hypothetical protein
MERDGCRLKVIFTGANPQTQRQASSRKRVQAGDLFGQHGCTVERREQNGGHQADTVGGACRSRQGNEWIIVVKHQAVDETQAASSRQSVLLAMKSGAFSPLWGSAFGATAHVAVHDTAHDAFMTLPHHTRIREGEVQPAVHRSFPFAFFARSIT